ncbi:MAG: ABC-F family ATP-binding cassette domain-containing protein [Bdellovibrionota bacterium]|nr:ABC-F family ATP-binding cassette domain-containing protein [Bdellovibrionota bacterium]
MEKVLISLSNISQEFSGKTLFRDLSLTISEFDKVALIGPNGTGKSTLLKIIAGIIEAEQGSVKKEKGLLVSYIEQKTDFKENTAYEVLLNGAKNNKSGFEPDTLAKKFLSQNNIDGNQNVSNMSGGQKKRLAILKALIANPDIVLFDEPTNHLDFNGIEFLENYLNSPNITWVLVTHDRTLLERCPKKIVEIDSCYKNNTFEISGDYRKFIEQKELYIQSVINKKDAIKSILRKENEWLSRMPKARGTKAKFRVENAYNLQDELRDTEKLLNKKSLDFEIQSTDRKTKELLKIKNLSFSFPNKKIVQNFSCLIRPKDCIGILGNNGIGKTTLLKLIIGQINGYEGEIKTAHNLKIKLFSQLRNEIPLDYTLSKALSPKSDSVVYQNKEIHIIPWAKKFLFSEADLTKPLSSLSGGELARVYISRIITEEADLLVLDEPTNDLDISSIEVLEDAILEFNGAVLLVTHDRKLIDNLCNFCIGFVDNEGTILPFADYEQWISFLKKKKKEDNKKNLNNKENLSNEKLINNNKSKKLTFKEKKEFDEIMGVISNKEQELENTKNMLNLTEVISDHIKLKEVTDKIETLETELKNLYDRWEYLESKNEL